MYINELASIPVTTLKWVTPRQKALLKKMEIHTVADLLNYFPFRYDDRSQTGTIQDGVLSGNPVNVVVRVMEFQWIYYNRRRHPKIVIEDDSTRAFLIGFNREYLTRSLKVGQKYWLNAQFVYKFNEIQASTFDFEEYQDGDSPEHFGKILPVYKLTENLQQKHLRKIIEKTLEQYVAQLDDELPPYIRERHNLIGKQEALQQIHSPIDDKSVKKSRLRLAFEELLAIQLLVQSKRSRIQQIHKNQTYPDTAPLQKILEQLPYSLTHAQQQAVYDITTDMCAPQPMHRLLQGDVGSGKTTVALCALALAGGNHHQGALLVPTEVLAGQHYAKIRPLLENMGIHTVLLSGGLSAAERQSVLENIRSGTAQVVIGTHALFQDDVLFSDLTMVVIDEQHKFGVEQRVAMANKGHQPDLIVMTATPIPRTLTMTLYGDLDVSVINELPAHRKPVITKWVTRSRYSNLIDFVRKEIQSGHQAYFIYPLIEGSEKIESRAAAEMFDELKRYLPGIRLGLIHGRMKSEEKDEVMRGFQQGEIQVLVSTTVVEVGVDIPNATVMVIENCERFGLSQLHQLRGRVGRGADQSHCFLVTPDDISADTRSRLQIMVETSDGFRIAEEDLKTRGPGELLGVRQSGIPEIKFAEFLTDTKLLSVIRQDAATILKNDPTLDKENNRPLRDGILRFLPADFLQSG